MVYRRDHWPKGDICEAIECKLLTAYIRIEGKWTKIGHFGSECKKFEPLDLQQEEQERLPKQRPDHTKSEMRQVKQENRERLKIIENELNVNKSFFK